MILIILISTLNWTNGRCETVVEPYYFLRYTASGTEVGNAVNVLTNTLRRMIRKIKSVFVTLWALDYMEWSECCTEICSRTEITLKNGSNLLKDTVRPVFWTCNSVLIDRLRHAVDKRMQYKYKGGHTFPVRRKENIWPHKALLTWELSSSYFPAQNTKWMGLFTGRHIIEAQYAILRRSEAEGRHGESAFFIPDRTSRVEHTYTRKTGMKSFQNKIRLSHLCASYVWNLR